MPLITASHDSLPYIDPEPTPSERAAAQSLIDAELSKITIDKTPTDHDLLPSLPPSNPTPAMAEQYARLSLPTSTPLTGIDLSRYEAPTAPEISPSIPTKTTRAKSTRSRTAATTPQPPKKNPYTAPLTAAHTSTTYLTHRTTNLTTLNDTGKPIWLASNDALVAILGGLEKELADAKEAIDVLAVQRRQAQDGVRAEVEALEKAWKDGVGKVLEVEVAAEAVRGEVLGIMRRRVGAE